jgi:soluble P-type ATPase
MTERGIDLEIREGETRRFTDLLLDYTGTLSLDGILLPGIAERLTDLAQSIRITVLTADTFGQAERQLEGLPLTVRVIRTGIDKASFVQEMGPERVIAIGNGRNDVPMMLLARLGLAVVGPEGAAAELLRHADVVVTDVHQALDLISSPLRLKATLRD